MRPVEIQTAIDIDRPPPDVWPFIADFEGITRWMSEAMEVRIATDHREGVGVEAEAIVRIGGIKTADRIRVTKWKPPTVLEMQHLGWVKGTGVMWCFEAGRGTHLYWRETLLPPWGPLGAMGLRIFRRRMRKIFAHDLSLLKALVESETAA